MMRFSKAFTLAEILIALTIIGVISALTIPNVMINTNASHAKTALKKAVASINQAILTNAAQDGYTCAEAIGTGDHSLYHMVEKYLDVKLLNANATKDERWDIYANFIDLPTLENSGGGNNPTISDSEVTLKDAEFKVRYYSFADGMTLIMPPNLASCGNPRILTDATTGIPTVYTDNGSSACVAFLDINGSKGPNQVIGCEKKPDEVSQEANDYIAVDYSNGVNESRICELREKSITDVYPLIFYNDKVYPGTYAAMTVFMEAQKEN